MHHFGAIHSQRQILVAFIFFWNLIWGSRQKKLLFFLLLLMTSVRIFYFTSQKWTGIHIRGRMKHKLISSNQISEKEFFILQKTQTQKKNKAIKQLHFVKGNPDPHKFNGLKKSPWNLRIFNKKKFSLVPLRRKI